MPLRDHLSVMVVDDMSTSRGVIAQALDAFGIRHVSVSADGASALRAVEQTPVDLVISDYHMPQMDGLALLSALRQNPRTAQIRFLLITGTADADILASGRRMGMTGYLLKPFTLIELKSAIETIVGRI